MTSVESVISQSSEEEKQELQNLLNAGILHKAPNLQRFLEYVCDRYFAGQGEEIKEYSIAVNALNRSTTFNPQSDTIVRVTAHSLRKRLDHYYATEGADHALQIVLRPGQYLPQFVRQVDIPHVETPGNDSPVLSPKETATESGPSAHPLVDTSKEHAYRLRWWIGIAFVLCAAALVFVMFRHGQSIPPHSSEHVRTATWAIPQAGSQTAELRFLAGENRKPLTDAAGRLWSADRYCTGGNSFSRPNQTVQGVDESQLFTGGREGKFQCRIPVQSGIYELHLFFADTADERVATRQVVFYINNGSAQSLDVVDDAGGDNVPTEKVYTGVKPMSDGTIHLDFTSDGAFVDAIELLPSGSDKMLPIHMVAGPTLVHDKDGNVWLPEGFFSGGRRSYHQDLPHVPDAELYQWERFGHFRYALSVLPGRTYTVTLFLSEAWFGTHNGGTGGVGSRVFDVYCNGTTLLKDFDILKEQKNGAVVKALHHIPATAQGKLEISFIPRLNYPTVNAIAVDQEPDETATSAN